MNVEAGGVSHTAMQEPLTPGEWPRRERERSGMSLARAAEELRLDVRLVEAIENNRFEALGAPVYAKGHLRKYATVLGLSPDAVMASYHALADTPAVPTPIPKAPGGGNYVRFKSLMRDRPPHGLRGGPLPQHR